jgi:hypothetical protein
MCIGATYVNIGFVSTLKSQVILLFCFVLQQVSFVFFHSVCCIVLIKLAKGRTKFGDSSTEALYIDGYEVDGYVYSAAEEPKIMITGKWNKSLSCQPCDQEGDPLLGTELKEVGHTSFHFL